MGAVWLLHYLSEAHPDGFHLINAIAFAILGLTMATEELASRHLFDQSYDRYLGRRELAPAAS
jgi:hypothetical protein